MTTPRMGLELVDPAVAQVTGINRINSTFTKLDGAAGYVMCTSTTRPTANLFIGMQIYETDTHRRYVNPTGIIGEWFPIGGDTVDSPGNGVVRVTRPGREYGLDTNHSSAPSVVYTLQGELIMVYRLATDHSISRDGTIQITRSLDGGKTWTNPTTALTLQPEFDLQGQGISQSKDGTILYLSYFKATSSLGAAGVYLRSSVDDGVTWGSEIRIDDGLPYAATTDSIHELVGGTLVMVYYGRAGAETIDSAWIAKSVDGGLNWTNTRLLDGETDSRFYQEPVIAMNGTKGVITCRWDTNNGITTLTTIDNTVNWVPQGNKSFDGTGKPNVFWVNELTCACIYRQITTGWACIRTSNDGGLTWLPPDTVAPVMDSPGWMLYASAARISNGISFVAYAMERTSAGVTPGVSRIYLAYAIEGGGQTPFGNVPRDYEAARSSRSEEALSTYFEYPDGNIPYPWQGYVMNGGEIDVGVQRGWVHPLSQNVFTIPLIHIKQAGNVDMEADIWCSSGNGSSAGLVFKCTGPGTFLIFVAEDSQLRLYKYVDGSAQVLHTQSTGSNAFSFPYNSWNTMGVRVRNESVICLFNGWSCIAYTLSPSDRAFYANGNYFGFKLLRQSTDPIGHRCRRFVIHAHHGGL